MKYQSLFSGKNKKNIISLLPAEFAQRVVKVKALDLNTSTCINPCPAEPGYTLPLQTV